MISFQKKNKDPWGKTRWNVPEDFWASYSDLMAALLMVFALITVITLFNIGKAVMKPAQQVEQWRHVVQNICDDKDLKGMKNVSVNCDTGALTITNENLRFGFSSTHLGEEAKNVLHEVVPKYFEIIYQKPELLKQVEVIEISGHTDREDKNQANPGISRERAGQVLEYLLSDPSMEPYVAFLRTKAITAGYSDIDFPNDCAGDNCPKARRVEIAVKLDDSQALRKLIEMLKGIYKKA